MNLKAVNVSIVIQIKNEIATMPMLIQTQNVYMAIPLVGKVIKRDKIIAQNTEYKQKAIQMKSICYCLTDALIKETELI